MSWQNVAADIACLDKAFSSVAKTHFILLIPLLKVTFLIKRSSKMKMILSELYNNNI
jgi:hypothetical protein